MSSPPTTSTPLNPAYEMTKAFLFLRTASTAITNTKEQIKSSEAYITYNSINGNYSDHMYYEERQREEEKELKKWEARFVQAAVQIVDWTAKISLGKWLPREIIGIIEDLIARDDDLVLRRIW